MPISSSGIAPRIEEPPADAVAATAVVRSGSPLTAHRSTMTSPTSQSAQGPGSSVSTRRATSPCTPFHAIQTASAQAFRVMGNPASVRATSATVLAPRRGRLEGRPPAPGARQPLVRGAHLDARAAALQGQAQTDEPECAADRFRAARMLRRIGVDRQLMPAASERGAAQLPRSQVTVAGRTGGRGAPASSRVLIAPG